jgi:hypothetical protein
VVFEGNVAFQHLAHLARSCRADNSDRSRLVLNEIVVDLQTAMAGISDLLRSMRQGGGGGVAAAQELVRRAQQGEVNRAELSEAQHLATLPEAKDAFADVARDLANLASPSEPSVFRDVRALTPDTKKLNDAKALPERFLADFKLQEQQLLLHPGLTAAQKAERLFSFFEVYAARFVELQYPQGIAQPQVDYASLHAAVAHFERVLTGVGFAQLVASDGRTGLTAARQMLEAQSKLQFDKARPTALEAPGWKDNPAVTRAEPRHLPLSHAPVPPPLEADQKRRHAHRPARSGVLGGNMLWNVLHLIRDEDLTDVERKDAMTQLAIAALLILILGAILIGVWVLL